MAMIMVQQSARRPYSKHEGPTYSPDLQLRGFMVMGAANAQWRVVWRSCDRKSKMGGNGSADRLIKVELSMHSSIGGTVDPFAMKLGALVRGPKSPSEKLCLESLWGQAFLQALCCGLA